MNSPTHRDPPDIPADEWQAQEAALRAERLGLADGDPRLDEYRRIARALRRPLPDPLPADFADRVAHRAGRASRGREWVERLLGGSLVAALLVASFVFGVWHDDAGWHALSTWLSSGLLLSPWALSLAGCLGLTLLVHAWPGPRHWLP